MCKLNLSEITAQQKEIFNKYFCDETKLFHFEGMWLRNQRKENAQQSDWLDESTTRRRYIHFYDSYITKTIGDQHFLSLKDAYIYVTNTLPKNEIVEYKNRILNALKLQNYIETNSNIYQKDGFEVLLFEYKNHPKNLEYNVEFPENYISFDIVFRTKNFEYEPHYNRMWKHSTKMFRIREKRETPQYETDLKALKQFLPAQIETGCGPSIEANIPPLYTMHELYKVQNHESGKFYFSKQDDLMENIILNPEKMYKQFAHVPLSCLRAQHTEAYKFFDKAYKSGLFMGTVYNNNFDRLVKRFDIDEIVLRVYDKDKYLPNITFDKNAKSLICFGCHADRRQVQKQAREQGLKVIFVNPEGFYNKDKFEPYPLEAPKNQDIIYKMTFNEFMTKFKNEYLD
jgi:hypothetical protein